MFNVALDISSKLRIIDLIRWLELEQLLDHRPPDSYYEVFEHFEPRLLPLLDLTQTFVEQLVFLGQCDHPFVLHKGCEEVLVAEEGRVEVFEKGLPLLDRVRKDRLVADLEAIQSEQSSHLIDGCAEQSEPLVMSRDQS